MAHREVKQHLIDQYFKSSPGDAARILSTFDDEKALEYLKDQPAEIASEILSRMDPDDAADILELVDALKFKELLDHLNVFSGSPPDLHDSGQKAINTHLENLASRKSQTDQGADHLPARVCCFYDGYEGHHLYAPCNSKRCT